MHPLQGSRRANTFQRDSPCCDSLLTQHDLKVIASQHAALLARRTTQGEDGTKRARNALTSGTMGGVVGDATKQLIRGG